MSSLFEFEPKEEPTVEVDEPVEAPVEEPVVEEEKVSVKLVGALVNRFRDLPTGEVFVRGEPKEVDAETAERLLQRRRNGNRLFVRA
jgi:hypothetical protein